MNIAGALAAYQSGGRKTGGVLANPNKDVNINKGEESQEIKRSPEATIMDESALEPATSGTYSDERVSAEEKAKQNEEDTTGAEETQKKLESSAAKMTEEDLAELEKEGYSIDKMLPDQIEAAIERIHLQKELNAEYMDKQVEDIRADRDTAQILSKSKLNGNPKAKYIAEKLEKSGLPVTDANIEKVAMALDMLGLLDSSCTTLNISTQDAEYLVKNKMRPTIENVSMAQHTNAAGYNRKERPLSEESWRQLQPTVSHLLFQAGLKANPGMMEAAKSFIKRDIPLTSENMKYYSQLTKVSLTDNEVMDKIIGAITVGKDPKNADIASLSADKVKSTVSRAAGITNDTIEYAAAKEISEKSDITDGNDIELSLEKLFDAEDEINTDGKGKFFDDIMRDIQKQGMVQAASIKARRQLEEIKTKMTFESGYRLAKEGIRIDSENMNKLVDDLKILEDRLYSGYFRQAGIRGYSGEDMALFKDTLNKVNEIKNMPAGLIASTVDSRTSVTLDDLHNAGNDAAAAFRRYQHTLETVMTKPLDEYGDSLDKAFNNVDKILDGMNIEANDENRRAVRILGYNQMEITPDSLESVKEYDEQLNRVLSELHPAVTVRMIKEGINPLKQTLGELEEQIKQIKAEDGISDDEKYSNFLINLEKEDGITDEQRKAYIGIYRALHQIDKSEGAAVGTVYKYSQDMTLGNLLTAVRSGKASGIDRSVDETFGKLAQIVRNSESITDQIKAGYVLPNNGKDAIKEGAQQVDKMIQKMEQTPPEEIAEKMSNFRETAADSTNASRFLEDYNILPTMENIVAAKEMLEGNTDIFREWKRFKDRLDGNGELPDFVESLDSKESMAEAYTQFLSDTKEIKQQFLRNPEMTKIDVKALKKMDVAARFMNRLSKREYYQIPMETSGDIVNVNVTILHSDEEKGKVVVEVPTECMGKVTAEASIKNNQIKCFISTDTREGTDVLKERQINLMAILAQENVEVVSLYYGTEERSQTTYQYKTDGAYQELHGSEESQKEVGTNDLYRVAKAILLHVRQTDDEVFRYAHAIA